MSSKPSDVQYFWFIGFQHNELVEKPFQIFVREYFCDVDIPDEWFDKLLAEDSRLIKLNLEPIPGNDL